MELLKLLVVGILVLAPVVVFGQDTNAILADSADINECDQDPNPCGIHNCVNTQGSYNCTCLSGYSKNAEGVCTDIDDCAAGACGIHTCLNQEGTYQCTCLEGYEMANGVCVDQDECSIGDTNGGCNENTTDCYNTAGAHKCECKSGFERLPSGSDSTCVDKDECVTGDHTCNSTTEVCVNTLGEHVCECASGYEKNAENKCVVAIVEDSDTDNDHAVEETLCTEECTATQYCGTVPDYEKIQAAVNETVPDYSCIETGWRPGACSMAYANCDPVANCTDGEKGTYSYKCTCPDEAIGDGYVNGTGCELLYKVCSDNFDCPDFGHCNEEFKCQCNDGYEGDSRYNCTDIVDCPADCASHADCKETPGSYMCTCDVANGFYGDGKTCTYRCYADDDCHWDGYCVGATQECDCKAGYEGNGTKIAGGCEDVKECEDPALNNCHENARCIEEAGSYSCECSNGYEGDGIDCKKIQKSCQDILDIEGQISFGGIYTIDPDFNGPANPFEVRCQRARDGVVYTELRSKHYPIKAEPTTEVEYQADDDSVKAFTNSSGFCKQQVEFECGSSFALFPGTTWFDIHGKAHQSWGSPNDQECACGAVGECVSKCMCDGTRYTKEKAYFFNKDELPVRRFQFDQPNLDAGSIRYVGALLCADQQFEIPKDCHEAKWKLGMRTNRAMYIDADGVGGAEPFLALCDMETYDHVGITVINPINDMIHDPREGRTVDYNNDEHQIKALIDGSLFCSQRVEFQCKDSPLLGQDGGYVSGPNQRLDYFPGALGEQGSCGCGATKSCDKPDVTCNCNIQDGTDRKDFGLIIDKNDLPAVSVTAAIGDHRSSTYKIGGLQCSQKQFGIEPNCQKYLIGQNINEDYTYLVDADGPNRLEPFLVECKFTERPPMGKTIFHHNWEGNRTVVEPNYFLKYLNVTPDQIDRFKERSPATVCSQDVTIGCIRYNLKYDDKAATWKTADGLDLELAFNMDSCSLDGTNCACTSSSETTDKGTLIEQPQLPLQSLDFSSTANQFRAEIEINVGPMVCAELFPTCAELKKFIDSPASAQGESVVYNGKFTIDPDGLGGVEPFEVVCQFPATVIEITPGDGDIVSPDPNANNTGNSSAPASVCYPVTYSDGLGNPITPEQITALVQASGDCKQPLEIECQNTPVSQMINYTSCDGVTQPGWAGSFGEEKCACGVNGNCAGGVDANCNCDMADDELRSDGGTIVETDRLPVCQVCLSTPADQMDPTQPPPPPRRLKYTLGKLECNGPTGTGGQTCQEARKSVNSNDIDGETEVGITLMEDNPAPVGCRFINSPPVGELLVKPKIPVYPPGNDTDPVDVDIIYINININITRPAMDANEYCSQVVYLFCANDYDLTMGGNNVWMDFQGNEFIEWDELSAGHEDVNAMCEEYEELCAKCGSPRGFKVGVKERLPIKRIKLDVTGVTVVVGEVACLDILMSCQDIVDQPQKRFSGYLGGNDWVIDPDAAGDIKPFRVDCHQDWNGGNGVTEIVINPGGFWTGSPPRKEVSNIEEPASFSLPIEYKDATNEQVEALTKVSGFCWQNVKYECTQAPISKDGQTSTLIQGMNGVNATGFGTDFQGCACSQTGTCEVEGLACNCDAMTTSVDQGSVTDKDLLPITNVLVGGQSALGSATTTVSSIRCSNKAVDPPRDCADAYKKKNSYGNDYTKSGEFLISPDPENPSIKPFMVRCDFDLIPGQGVTIVNPHYPENTNTSDPKHKNKINITTTPGSPGGEEVTEFTYYIPSVDQIKALVTYSEYCYQGVRIECQNTALFSEGSRWYAAGDESMATPITFWGGGNPASSGKGFCACGASSNCGGLDSSSEQRERHCNCDANDGEMRADAGILTDKAFMPVGNFVTGSTVSIGSLNMTVGPVFCSDKPIPMNECEMGFHDCHEQATCRDTEENYRCECNPGWRGKGAILSQASPRANGRECIDDNECSWNPCHYDQHCNNFPGTYNCTCKSGLDQTGPMECVDIDECANETLNECHEHAECKNTHRSYECRCKSGFRGDGREECIPVGQCFSFGDPHLISFDQKWLHFMGDCEYTMAQDGCNGTDPTWKVNVAHWKENNVRPGYYAWIKEVTIQLPVVGFTIKLFQGHGIEVNGVAMTQFHDAHRVSVTRVLDQVKVKVITGLEVNWDGRDVLEVYVPIGDTGKTCGMCGNFNQDDSDDWTIGPACPAKEGQITDNFDLFGRSWTVTDSNAQCTADCSNTKPNPNITTCVLPQKMVEQECDKLLVVPKSPFTECLKLKSPEVLKELRYSCMMDGCNEEYDIRGRMCLIAKAIFQHCATFDNIRIDSWRLKVEACDTPTCDNGMEYKSCGSANPETCLSSSVELDTLDTGDVCADGCFCPDGTLQEGDKCVKPEDCGCFYGNEYLAAGEEVVMPNCGDTLKCHGRNYTEVTPMDCTEDQECGISEITGKRACVCVDGLKWDPVSKSCVVDSCSNVTCDLLNAVCDPELNGTCKCADGYMADCNVCEDIDECLTGVYDCDTKSGYECVNTEGSYVCVCGSGLITKGDKCEDIDECAYDGIQDCGSNSQCVNLFGGATCECCAGYKKNDDDKCVPDGSRRASGGRCCHCVGHLCGREGKVCGDDANTYASYRDLQVNSCRQNKDIKVSYSGECQSSCETTICEKKFSNCTMDDNNKPQCACPTCENITTSYEEDLVCATNKITYISICHLKADLCASHVDTQVEIEVIGKPCPEGNGTAPPAPGDWSEWGPCSEDCKQGTTTRNRAVNGTRPLAHAEETKSCYATCPNGPCTPTTCETPGSMCTVNADNSTECSCPNCTEPYVPVCGQVGNYVSTFENLCSLDKAACEQEQPYEVLEMNACEDKPKGCGRVRRFKVYEDDQGYMADRELDLGYCYGGCAEGNENNNMCCQGTKFEYKFAILTMQDPENPSKKLRKNKFIKQIKDCDCVDNDAGVEEPVMNMVQPDMPQIVNL